MESLSIGFVPGVTPGKWVGRWRERHPEIPIEAFPCDVVDQIAILHTGRADMGLVRFPLEDSALHIIPLYTEQPVVVGHKDHEMSVFDEVALTDLDDPFLDPRTIGGEAMAVEIAASGAGLVILPMSVARLYNRKDVVFRPVSGVPESRIGLAWPVANTSELTEEFVGIVRGRTANSSRQPSAQTKRSGTGQQTGPGAAGRGGGAERNGGAAGRGGGGSKNSERKGQNRSKGSSGRTRRHGDR